MNAKKLVLGFLAAITVAVIWFAGSAQAATAPSLVLRSPSNNERLNVANLSSVVYMGGHVRNFNDTAQTIIVSFSVNGMDDNSWMRMVSLAVESRELKDFNVPKAMTLREGSNILSVRACIGDTCVIEQRHIVVVLSADSSPGGEGESTEDDGLTEGEGDAGLNADEPKGGECASILTWMCDDPEGGVWLLLQLILDIMTAGVIILATVGMVISGIQWITARDKEDQIIKARSRIFNIVIGLVVWALLWLILSWLIPGFTVEGS